MELLIGDTIQYKHDDWSYVVREINTSRETGHILYECISPDGGDNSMVWAHTVQGVLDAIDWREITIIKRTLKPIKNLSKFNFT